MTAARPQAGKNPAGWVARLASLAPAEAAGWRCQRRGYRREGHSGASGLRDRRRRLGRLRPRQPADRGPRDAGGADRGRRARLEPADPHPGRVHEAARPSDLDLGLQGRGRSRHRRPRDPLSARPRARRLVVDQRADLHPRPARGFRPLGAARQSRLGLGRRAALFQAGRELAGRGQRTARHGRVPDHLADERAAGGVPGDHRCRRELGARIPAGRQQSAAGRRATASAGASRPAAGGVAPAPRAPI